MLITLYYLELNLGYSKAEKVFEACKDIRESEPSVLH
jgi:hypothetical protein